MSNATLSKKNRNGRIFSKWWQVIIVAVTLAAVAVVIFLGRQSYRETREVATKQFNQQQLILARSAAVGIESCLQAFDTETRLLAKMPVVQKMMLECLLYMRCVYGEKHKKTSMRWIDKNGVLRLIYPNEGWRKELIGRSYSEEDYFIEARETRKCSVSGLVINEQGDMRIRMAYSMLTGGEFIGCIVGSLNVRTLARLHILPIVSGKTGYAWLLNKDGIFLAHHEEKFIGKNAFEAREERKSEVSYEAVEQIQRKMMAGEEGIARYVSGWHREHAGKCEKFVAYSPIHIEGNGIWSVAVCAPVSEVEAIINKARRSELYRSGFVILSLIAGGLFLSIGYHCQSRFLEQEVTERTRELKETGARYHLLMETANDAIYALDSEMRVTDVNLFAERILGHSRDEVIGRSYSELGILTPESLSKAIKDIARVFAGESVADAVYEFVTKDERHLFGELSAAPIYEAGKAVGVLTIARDITERRNLEEQVRQSQKMEAIGILAAGVAHDFNNILTAIQGYNDLALMTVQKDEQLHRNLNEVRKASMRAANLTRQLLLFSRRHPMAMAPLDFNELIQELVKMLDRLIGEDVSLSANLGTDLWTINGDAGTIEQVIMNLTVNARDAMPNGGEITIKTKNALVDEEYCKTRREARSGKFVYLSIQDTGEGMAQEVVNRIFEPFFTTKGAGKGTGMGLSVVYGIVKQHGGWIDVESSPGSGTIFEIYLPAISIKPEEPQETTVSQELLMGKGERILLVEDDIPIQEFVTTVLAENGFVVFTATSAQEALDVFQKETRNFDLIFCDVVLPDKRGPGLVKQLLKLKPGINVLFTSGYSDDKSDWRAIQESGYPYIQKPYSLPELFTAVEDALRK